MGISPVTAKEISYRLTGEISPNIEELKDTHKLAEEISLFFSDIDKLYEPCLLLNNDGEPVEALPFPYLTKGARIINLLKIYLQRLIAFTQLRTAKTAYTKLRRALERRCAHL